MAEGNTPKPVVPTTATPLAGPDDAWGQWFGDQAEQQYIFNDIRQRHLAVLLQDATDFYWLKRKLSGTQCPYWSDESGQCVKPIDPRATCYGTRWLGGYEAPLLIKVALPSKANDLLRSAEGLVKASPMKPWTVWEPALADGDMIVHRQTGERYEISQLAQAGPWRGLIVAQFFDVRLMQAGQDYAMLVPVPLIEGA